MGRSPWRLATIATAMLVAGCAGQQQLTYGGSFTQPPKSGAIAAEVVYGTLAETRERCVKANRLIPGRAGPPSCVWFTPWGSTVVYAVQPASWDDAEAMCQLGHEVTHLLKGEH